MIQARSQLAELQRAEREAVLRLPPLLKSEYNSLVENEKNLDTALADQEKASLAAQPGKHSLPRFAAGTATQTARLYESVLKRIPETGMTTGLPTDPVQIVEPATFSPVPISPIASRVLLLGHASAASATGVGIVATALFPGPHHQDRGSS